MIYVLILLATFILFTFLGYVFHWMFHQKWSGFFYKAHDNHHNIQYPISDLISEKYREAGKDNSTFLFAIAFAPIIIVAVLLIVFGVIGKLLGAFLFVEMSIIGATNIWLHDGFHIHKSVWHKWPGFLKLRKLHFLHHKNTLTNFGIFSFTFDKLFGTYKEE